MVELKRVRLVMVSSPNDSPPPAFLLFPFLSIPGGKINVVSVPKAGISLQEVMDVQ